MNQKPTSGDVLSDCCGASVYRKEIPILSKPWSKVYDTLCDKCHKPCSVTPSSDKSREEK